MKNLRSKRLSSFTLVEVLIALAIIIFLTAIATPSVIAYMNRAKIARAYMEMNYIKTSLQTFYNDWGEYPSTVAELRGTGTVNASAKYTVSGIEGPIDYLDKAPPIDLFYKEIDAEPEFGKTYRYATNTVKDDFVLWSYGPNKAGLTSPGTTGTLVFTTKDIDDIVVRP